MFLQYVEGKKLACRNRASLFMRENQSRGASFKNEELLPFDVIRGDASPLVYRWTWYIEKGGYLYMTPPSITPDLL